MNQPQMAPQAAPQMEPPKKGVGAWLWIVLIIVVLGAAGYFGWYFFGNKITGDNTLTPLPQTLPTDTTASWKTYTSKNLGFSIKHPQTWTATETKTPGLSVSFASPETVSNKQSGTEKTTFDLSIGQINGNADSPKNFDEVVTKDATVKKIGDTTIDGVKAVDATRGGVSTDYVIYVSNNGKFLEIVFPNIATKSQLTTTGKQILATFKFTTASTGTDTSGTTSTYTNTDYGFTMTFPTSWDGYKMKAVDIDGAVKVYYCNFPTTDSSVMADESTDSGYFSPFAIGVYTPAQWAAVEAEDGPKPRVLEETDEYVFTGSQANGIPPTDFKGLEDISGIFASFTISE